MWLRFYHILCVHYHTCNSLLTLPTTTTTTTTPTTAILQVPFAASFVDPVVGLPPPKDATYPYPGSIAAVKETAVKKHKVHANAFNF